VGLAPLTAEELDRVEIPLCLEREGGAHPSMDELHALGFLRERHRIGLATSRYA
jgi:hypothetical protein